MGVSQDPFWLSHSTAHTITLSTYCVHKLAVRCSEDGLLRYTEPSMPRPCPQGLSLGDTRQTHIKNTCRRTLQIQAHRVRPQGSTNMCQSRWPTNPAGTGEGAQLHLNALGLGGLAVPCQEPHHPTAHQVRHRCTQAFAWKPPPVYNPKKTHVMLQLHVRSGMHIPSLRFPPRRHHAPFLRFLRLWLRHPLP